MTNIPPPGYSNYGYGTLRSDFAGGPGADPWAAYGVGGGGESYQSPEIQQYVQQLYTYAQTYQQIINQYPGTQMAQQAQQYMQMLNSYLAQVGAQPISAGSGWDPSTGQMGGPGAMGGPQIPTPDYQDTNQLVYENGPSFTWTVNQSEKREVHLYQADSTVEIPSNADNAKVEIVPDPNFPGKNAAVVTVTFRDGSTQKIYVHNLDRENAHVNVSAASPDQVDISAVGAPYTDKVTKGELGTGGATDQLGDPPTKMEGGKRIYDGQSFNISPVPEGSNKETEVMASGDVTITPNSNSEWYTVEYDATTKDYTVKVYKDEAKTQLKETIKIDGELVDHLYFAGDQSRVDWGTMAKTGKPHEIDSAKPGADKVAFSGEAGATGAAAGQPVNPNSPADSNTSRIEGDTAYYEDDADVDITNYFDGDIKTYDVTASGTVTLHAAKQIDSFTVTYEGTPPYYKIVAHGKDKDGHAVNITYKVAAGQVDKIVFDNVDPSQVDDTAVPADKKSKIQKGAEASGTTGGAETEGLPDQLKSLMGLVPGLTLDTLKVQLLTHGYFPGKDINTLTVEDIKKAFDEGALPPALPDEQLINFLYIIDPKLKNYLEAVDPVAGDPQYSVTMKNVSTRLIELLKSLYPTHDIKMDPGGTTWGYMNNISFDGHIFEAYSEVEGHRGESAFAWYS